MRASTRIFANFDIRSSGDMACESSSENASGSSLTFTRMTASGARGPSAARANTKTVSPGLAFAASAGDSETTPLTPVNVPAEDFAEALVAGDFALFFPWARAASAREIASATACASSDSGGMRASTFFQYIEALRKSPRSKAALPANTSDGMWSGLIFRARVIRGSPRLRKFSLSSRARTSAKSIRFCGSSSSAAPACSNALIDSGRRFITL